jgi:hypothetical protein
MDVMAMSDIDGEHYTIDDELPTLDLHPAVEVRLDIEETGIKLFIGLREYEWPRGCPDVCSEGRGSVCRWIGRKRWLAAHTEDLLGPIGTRMRSHSLPYSVSRSDQPGAAVTLAQGIR